jgi:uncharacterized protein
MRCFKILFVLLFPLLVQAQPPPDGKITIGKIDSLWSKTLKEERQYGVYLPQSYNKHAVFLPKKYPVLYLLDGDAHFHSLTGVIQFLSEGINGNRVIPDMIVIAIPNTDRNRDLTPTHADKGPNGEDLPFLKTSGGGTNFLNFIKNELIPQIDSTYSTSPFRVLVGHSFGGIMVINALYTMPETFNAYIAIDPSLWYDNQLLLKKAKDFFQKADLKNKALFVGQANTIQAGSTDRNLHFESILQFNSIMETYNRSGLRYGYKYYDKDDHGSVPLITEYDGLRFIFDDYKFNFFDPSVTADAVKEHYKNFSAKLNAAFLPAEEMLNTVGYQMLQRGDTAKALEYFQLNIELYPQSFNTWDSMAETLMAKGDYKKAISYYEKSVALNPKNENGRQMIKKMKEQMK